MKFNSFSEINITVLFFLSLSCILLISGYDTGYTPIMEQSVLDTPVIWVS